MFHHKPDAPLREAQATAAPARAQVVDIDLSDLTAATPAPEQDRGWLESAQDLQRGMRVCETPLHSLPAALIDAFLRRRL